MGVYEYELAIDLMSNYPQLKSFVGPRSENLIKKAEESLGLKFPTTYRRFILEYGAGAFGGFEVYGVIDDNFHESTVPNGIWITLRNREKYNVPRELICIGTDGIDHEYMIDSQIEKNGENPVVLYIVGLSAQEQDIEMGAKDFGSYFLANVKDEISFRQEHGLLPPTLVE